MSSISSSYPATFEADAPVAQGRLGVFFRLILAIPQAIVVGLVLWVAQLLTFLAWFAILFTGKYPMGFANFVVGSLRWQARFNGYQYLLTGRYPPFSLDAEPDYPIRATFDVAAEGRNRLTVFFRVIMIIPHAVLLTIISMVASIVMFIAWIAALVTGSVPAGMHTFLTGVQNYSTRVSAYMFLLTDEYPPFSVS